MPTSILMPALSPTMEEGTLARWHVAEGDRIDPGDVIAEIETDKATMEFEAAEGGTIGRLLVPEGTEGVRVNSIHPGFIDTPILDTARGTPFEQVMLDLTPMGRLGRPEEIAAVVAFFVFRERLQRIQVIGVTIIAIGITLLAATQG